MTFCCTRIYIYTYIYICVCVCVRVCCAMILHFILHGKVALPGRSRSRPANMLARVDACRHAKVLGGRRVSACWSWHVLPHVGAVLL